MQGELKMKTLTKLSILFLFVCLLLISVSAIPAPTASALEVVTIEGKYVNEQVNVTLDKSAFVIFRMNNGTPIYAQGKEVGFIPRVTGELYIEALAGEERATELVSIVEKPGDGNDGDGNGGITYWWDCSVTLPSGTFTKTEISTGKNYTINWWTALGALHAASEKDGFDYKIIYWPYVGSIANKENGDEGPGSGWMYQVNGVTPMIFAHKQSVSTGEKVVWYFSKSMDTTPSTSSMVLRIKIVSSGGGPSGDNVISPTPTPTPVPVQIIEAGGNASLTFEETGITRIIINANNTIRNAEITIQEIGKPVNITNVTGIPYCYFNITTTNLTATDIATATIEFKVNKSWINENDIDETTITLNRYSNITGNWRALPTTKIEEDNTSLYFESETPGFSFFAVSGEKKTVTMATTEAPTAEATAIPVPLPKVTPVSSIPTPVPLSTHIHGFPGSLILIVIAVIVIGGIIIVVVLKRKK